MTHRLMIETTVGDIDLLWHQAVKHGFTREEPRKRWSEREKREAAKYEVQHYIESLRN